MQYGVTSAMEAEYITLSETMREILSSSWQMGDSVSMQPVPTSNVRSRKQDRTYKVVAHTTETQTRSTSMS